MKYNNKLNQNKQMKTLEITVADNYVKPELPMGLEWFNALMSGKYQQGKGMLCENGKYCCLGVLSELQGRLRLMHGSKSMMLRDEGVASTVLQATNPMTKYLAENGKIPDGVSIRFMNYNVDDENHDTISWSLAEINDYGFSFKVIAQIISICWELK